MVRDMFKMGMVVDCYNFTKNGEGILENQLKKSILDAVNVYKSRQPSFDINQWIDQNTGEMIFFKNINEGVNGASFENGKYSDLLPTTLNGKYFDPVRNDIDIIINPLLEFFFWSHNAMTSNYNLMTAGGIHAHEIKGKPYDPKSDKKVSDAAKKDSEFIEQLKRESIISSRTTASDKRNVFA